MRIKDLLAVINEYSKDCVCDGYDQIKGRKCTADFLSEDLARLKNSPGFTSDPEKNLILETIVSYSKIERDILLNALLDQICLNCRENNSQCFCSYDVNDRD